MLSNQAVKVASNGKNLISRRSIAGIRGDVIDKLFNEFSFKAIYQMYTIKKQKS